VLEALRRVVAGCENGRFRLQTLMEGFGKAAADMLRLTQDIANQVIDNPIPVGIRLSFELVQKYFCLILEHLTIHQRRYFLFHAHHLLFSLVPNNGRKFVATTSRARKMRDLTVPIGQFITDAISS